MTIEHYETRCLIRLNGPAGLGSAPELKTRLLEGLASGKDLEVDLKGVDEVHVSVLQLLWAADRDGKLAGRRVTIHLSAEVAGLARDAGFGSLSGIAAEIQA